MVHVDFSSEQFGAPESQAFAQAIRARLHKQFGIPDRGEIREYKINLP